MFFFFTSSILNVHSMFNLCVQRDFLSQSTFNNTKSFSHAVCKRVNHRVIQHTAKVREFFFFFLRRVSLYFRIVSSTLFQCS